MTSLFTIILSGMFAAMSYQGSLFRQPEYYVASIMASITLVWGIGGIIVDTHWMMAALIGYISGLIGCCAYDRYRQFRPQN